MAQVLRPLSGLFPTEDYPALLVGLAEPDDSAVYQLDDERAIVATTDFFPPVVDNPFDFGAIAAANALSDIYAMGGQPLFAINLVAFPDGLDHAILTEILRGGAEKVREAEAVIAGGHTVTDKEPKYGLAVTGIVHPQKIIRKSGAKIGDQLILTKPLGTGVITTALKRGIARSDHIVKVTNGMSQLNKNASALAQKYGVHAMTDITGYSLLGHAHEMSHLSHVAFKIHYSAIPWYEGALEYGQADIFPGGMSRNKDYFQQWIQFDDSLKDYQKDLLFDPQTSGGLLMAIPAEVASILLKDLLNISGEASIIGEVIAGNGEIYVTP